jgi:hypothetical protein
MATSAGATRPADQITFAHNSERQFARLLDFYRVEWEYEPTAFPIEWDAAGRPVQQFRPDFYLPSFGLYIEITTLNQRLVTKKNRKVRRLRELYPDVRIKVLYQRDYLSLLAKYGLEPPSQMVATPGGAGRLAALALEEGAAPESAAEPTAAGGGPGRAAGTAGAESGSGRDRAAGTAGAESGRGAKSGRGAGGAAGTGGAGADRGPGRAATAAAGRPGGAVERARAAGRPRVVPDPPRPAPPLPADPELVRLAQVLLPAERAHRRGPATAQRAG